MVGVAQLVEHWVVASVVAGSSPVTHPSGVRAGQMVAVREGLGQNLTLTKGGKSGLRRVGCSVTRSPGDGKESATENIPPDTQHVV